MFSLALTASLVFCLVVLNVSPTFLLRTVALHLQPTGGRLGEGGGSLPFMRGTNFQIRTAFRAGFTATCAKPRVGRRHLFSE